ncbi:hypothetical protein NDU88_002691 [Pleurodeles waltl]|uniref:Uncharacterized protein n=1 Tax=Pleurodeles waltl TaxID=8319 RepID=A0AAV7UWW7_PLEWA|nr:hypothetical protein NDU88_002691 [Pleurodeles waltl]
MKAMIRGEFIAVSAVDKKAPKKQCTSLQERTLPLEQSAQYLQELNITRLTSDQAHDLDAPTCVIEVCGGLSGAATAPTWVSVATRQKGFSWCPEGTSKGRATGNVDHFRVQSATQEEPAREESIVEYRKMRGEDTEAEAGRRGMTREEDAGDKRTKLSRVGEESE